MTQYDTHDGSQFGRLVEELRSCEIATESVDDPGENGREETSHLSTDTTDLLNRAQSLIERVEDELAELQRRPGWQKWSEAIDSFLHSDYESVLTGCTQLLDEFDGVPGYYYLRGAAHGRSGEYQSAIADFSAALRACDSLRGFDEQKVRDTRAAYLRERAAAYRAINEQKVAEEDERLAT
jgi:tetratricopeptide (TPR) repeat protein